MDSLTYFEVVKLLRRISSEFSKKHEITYGTIVYVIIITIHEFVIIRYTGHETFENIKIIIIFSDQFKFNLILQL